MNLAVTLGMKQYTVAHGIATAEDPPDDVVAAPPCHPGDLCGRILRTVRPALTRDAGAAVCASGWLPSSGQGDPRSKLPNRGHKG